MIYYLASYPRSGNSWLLQLVLYQFGLIPTQLYPNDGTKVNNRKWCTHLARVYPGCIEVPRVNPLARLLRPDPLAGKWMVYESSLQPGVRRKTLLPGQEKLLGQPAVRRRLGAGPDPLVIKTHALPEPEYCPGEHVIQVVRNPGASLWSYYNFARSFENRNPALSTLIDGGYGTGDWSGYHRAWARGVEDLPGRYLSVRYEDLFGRELEFCRQLEAFWGFPVVSTEIRTFETCQHLFRGLLCSGKAGGWEVNYSREQLRRLWERHGEMMTHYGYPEPDYNLGSGLEIH